MRWYGDFLATIKVVLARHKECQYDFSDIPEVLHWMLEHLYKRSFEEWSIWKKGRMLRTMWVRSTLYSHSCHSNDAVNQSEKRIEIYLRHQQMYNHMYMYNHLLSFSIYSYSSCAYTVLFVQTTFSNRMQILFDLVIWVFDRKDWLFLNYFGFSLQLFDNISINKGFKARHYFPTAAEMNLSFCFHTIVIDSFFGPDPRLEDRVKLFLHTDV